MSKKLLELNGTVTEMKKVLDVLVLGSRNANSTSTVTNSTSSVLTSTPTASTALVTSVVSTPPMDSTLVEAVKTTPPHHPISTVVTTEPASEVEISDSNLIPDAELMQIAMKSCSHMNFAAKLSVRLFDEETRLTHNVAGRGKPKLDPNIISYIKKESFDTFPCNATENFTSEWSSCITAIDERSRRLKNKIGKKKALNDVVVQK